MSDEFDESWEYENQWNSRDDDDPRTKDEFDFEHRVSDYGLNRDEMDS